MSYVKENLEPKEHLYAATHYHWAYVALAFFFLIAFGIFLIGIILFVDMIFRRYFSEFAVTSERVIVKRGFIMRDVDEVSINKIESVSVSQDILGRFLGYGTLTVRGVGIGEIVMPYIDRPFAFKRAIARAWTEKCGGELPEKKGRKR
ncbi:MAG: PH domain-containing protein [Alphaproteobacteria bacterium]